MREANLQKVCNYLWKYSTRQLKQYPYLVFSQQQPPVHCLKYLHWILQALLCLLDIAGWSSLDEINGWGEESCELSITVFHTSYSYLCEPTSEWFIHLKNSFWIYKDLLETDRSVLSGWLSNLRNCISHIRQGTRTGHINVKTGTKQPPSVFSRLFQLYITVLHAQSWICLPPSCTEITAIHSD